METVQSDDREWVTRVLDHLSGHVQSEERILERYEDVISSVGAADVRYLLELIADDEARHHRIFGEMAHAIEGSIRWEDIEPKVPVRTAGPLPEPLRGMVDELLHAEHEDRRHLANLRHQLAPVAKSTLWPLLLRMMEIDTEKHILILESLAYR